MGGSLLDQHIVCIRECAAFLPGDTQREIKPREGTHWRLWTALERERERQREQGVREAEKARKRREGGVRWKDTKEIKT